jgi:hypothetical protein
MRNIVFGAIGALWGGAILLRFLLEGGPRGQGSYAAGEWVGVVFGLLLLSAGLFYLVTGLRANRAVKPKKLRARQRPVHVDEDDED